MTVYGSPLSEIVLPTMSGSLCEAPLPQPVAEDDDLRALRAVLLGRERPAAQDRRAEQPEEVGGHLPRPQLLGNAPPV